MRKRIVRGYASASLALVTAAVLSSCSAGVDAGTLDPQRLSGAHAEIGLIKVRNALVVAPDDGDGDAELVMTVVNDGTTDDVLTGVQLAGGEGEIEVEVSPRSVDLPAESATVIPGESRPTVSITGDDLVSGTYVTATLSFESAGTGTMELLVLSETSVYGAE